MRAEQPQAYRYNRYPQTRGNFLSRIVQHIAKQTRLPQVWRELNNRLCQQPTHFAARTSFFRILFFGSNATAEGLVALALWLIKRSNFPVAALP